MKTKIIAAVAALAFALVTAPAFAGSIGGLDNCANVLANSSAYSPFDVQVCRH